MLRKCCVCGKAIGCYIGNTKVDCGNNYECSTARAMELCEDYPDNMEVSHGICEDCMKEVNKSLNKWR